MTRRTDTTKRSSLALPLCISCALHACALLFASLLEPSPAPSRPLYLPVRLVEAPEEKREEPRRPQAQNAAEKRKAPPRKEDRAFLRAEAPQEERPKADEAPSAHPASEEAAALAQPQAPRAESEPRAELAVAPKGERSDGMPASRLGKGEDSSGLARETRFRGLHREARPIESARANYPPMALRMGLEADVTLRIEVGSDGRVLRAEVVKAAGMGFDEEALRAVRQSRFEPAAKDGKNVPAEFTYVYRFRLRR